MRFLKELFFLLIFGIGVIPGNSQVEMKGDKVFVSVKDYSVDSILLQAGLLFGENIYLFNNSNMVKDINRKTFKDFDELIAYTLDSNRYLIQRSENDLTIIFEEFKDSDQSVTLLYQAEYTSTSVLVQTLKDLQMDVKTTEMGALGAVLLNGTFDQVYQALQLFNLIDEPSKAITVELLVVEYKHFNGYNWGINIQNGTSGEFSAVGYQPASTNSGINLTYNVTDMLENGFMLNLQALVENSIAKIATNPHITVNNGGDAEINITDDKYILLETATINGITTTLQDISTGIQLKITPRLAADSTIHLTVTSSISEFIATSVVGEYNIETNKVNTDIGVKDGETLIIGGLIREDRSNSEGGIPILKNIPLLGYLFKGVQDGNSYIETVIYITAYSQNKSKERGLQIDQTPNFYELEENEKQLQKTYREQKRDIRKSRRSNN